MTPAIEADGSIRDGADVAELTGLLDLSGWPPGMRIIVRRERPHPGAQLDAFEHRDGYRYQTFATNTGHGGGSIAFLEARHRAHAKVEDRIRCAKDSGLGRLPSRELAINTAWLELALTAADLTAWLQTAVLADQPALAKTEPKALLPAAAHRGPDHQGRPADLPQPRPHLALDPGDPHRVRPATAGTRPDQNTRHQPNDHREEPGQRAGQGTIGQPSPLDQLAFASTTVAARRQP